GGRQPLCGIGVTSLIAEIPRPAACSDRIAASRPPPGPRTHTSTRFMPCPSASRAQASAATWAANGVLLREPLKPTLPALAHVTTLPSRSLIVMIVLLKLACTWATPFEPTLRSRFFVFLTSATRYLRRGLAARSPGRLRPDRSADRSLRRRLGRRDRLLHRARRLLRALARPCIRPRALPAHRKPSPVPQAAIGADVHQ